MADEATTVPLGIRRRHRRSRRRVLGLVACVLVALGTGLTAAWLSLPSVSAAGDLGPAAVRDDAIAPSVTTPTPSRSARGDGVAPALTDDTGDPLPTTALAGIRAVFDALRANDVAAIGTRYRPTDVDASPWAVLEPRIGMRAVRTRLVSVMQQRPSRAEDVDILYGTSQYFLGFSDDGTLTYIEAGQNSAPATAPPPTTTTGFPTSASDPYGCLAADRALYAGLIGYAQHPCASHFQNLQDPSEMQPDTPATRWSFCHLPKRANDPSDVVRARERYC